MIRLVVSLLQDTGIFSLTVASVITTKTGKILPVCLLQINNPSIVLHVIFSCNKMDLS